MQRSRKIRQKNQSIETYTKMISMIKLIDKNIKTATINMLHMFRR